MPVGLPQQERTAVAGHRAAVERGADAARKMPLNSNSDWLHSVIAKAVFFGVNCCVETQLCHERRLFAKGPCEKWRLTRRTLIGKDAQAWLPTTAAPPVKRRFESSLARRLLPLGAAPAFAPNAQSRPGGHGAPARLPCTCMRASPARAAPASRMPRRAVSPFVVPAARLRSERGVAARCASGQAVAACRGAYAQVHGASRRCSCSSPPARAARPGFANGGWPPTRRGCAAGHQRRSTAAELRRPQRSVVFARTPGALAAPPEVCAH
jgi:hypothetical protein